MAVDKMGSSEALQRRIALLRECIIGEHLTMIRFWRFSPGDIAHGATRLICKILARNFLVGPGLRRFAVPSALTHSLLIFVTVSAPV